MPRVLVVLLLTLAWPAAAEAAALRATDRLTMQGLGPIKIGMTEERAERAAGMRLTGTGSGDDCRYVAPADRRIRAEIMLVNGRVVRIDLSRRGMRTRHGGVRVGDSEASVLRRVDGERVGPTKYFLRGHDIDLRGRGRLRNRMLRISTNDRGRVFAIQAGRRPEVTWVEGCL